MHTSVNHETYIFLRTQTYFYSVPCKLAYLLHTAIENESDVKQQKYCVTVWYFPDSETIFTVYYNIIVIITSYNRVIECR